MAERGNALFLILIAVALFAALSYAVTRSGKGGSGGTSKETATIEDAKIIQYAASVRQAVSRLTLVGGCTDRTVSFENSVVSGYINPFSPSDQSCHVFSSSGGGVAFQSQPAATGLAQPWLFNGGNAFKFLGTETDMPNGVYPLPSGVELAMYLLINSKALCDALNTGLGLPTTNIGVDSIGWAAGGIKFQGVYTGDNNIVDDGGDAAFTGVESACVQSHSSGAIFPRSAGAEYYFFNVLIIR